MNWSALPPLSALRAFAAYVDTGSVAGAGQALNVSHAAISQQLRALEAHLGLALLDRSGRQLALTTDGQALAFTLGEAFGAISDTIEALTGADAGRPLQVTCTPSFAASWLMPRLARFRAEHPGIDMMINPTPRLTDPAPGGIDVAIRYGTGPWPGLEHVRLLDAPLVVIGSPTLFPRGLPQTPADLLAYPWLQELGTNEATRWLADHGVSGAARVSVTQLPGNLILDGVREGQGIAVLTRITVAPDLKAGRVVPLFEDADGEGYNLVTRPGAPRPPLRDFLRWLRREAAKAE